MENRLLQILVCPVCKSPMQHDRKQNELICKADRLAFPIRDGVPIMLEDEARQLEPNPAKA
ncbi:MAG: Trm112 family protein [Alcaligenaceae bacterium]|nr:Trm112 family protein [Alcaligenaceae bacterium]